VLTASQLVGTPSVEFRPPGRISALAGCRSWSRAKGSGVGCADSCCLPRRAPESLSVEFRPTGRNRPGSSHGLTD